MKKRYLYASILQLVFGIAAVIMYVYLSGIGESTGKWTITLFLAIGYVVSGIIGIVDYNKNKIN
ncbi:MAG: hypothetical protein ACOX1L_06665 [Erysipelotrichaceae bacterium]